MRRGAWCALVALVLFTCCGSSKPLFDPDLDSPDKVITAGHQDDPTPEKPRLGCVGNPLGTPTVHGFLLPKPVLIVGVHDSEFFWGQYAESGVKPVLVRRDEVHFLCRGQR